MKRTYETPFAVALAVAADDLLRTSPALSAQDGEGGDIILDWNNL